MFAAAAANAASVFVESSSGTLVVAGEVITLQVRVTVSPADGTDTSIFGALVYPTGIGPVSPGTQTALPGTAFITGTPTCNTNRCVVFNQTSALAGPQTANVTNFLIATQNYTMPNTPGYTTLNWYWQTSPTTTSLDFFGATPNVPALSITVIGPFVPEPGTAALLGLGLLGLAAARRHA